MPLSIFTFGAEQDCGGPYNFPSEVKSLLPILQGPKEEWHDRIENDVWIEIVNSIWGVLFCSFGNLPLADEIIGGDVNKIYEPPLYGRGIHSNVVANNGDFTLRYTITVTPPPDLVISTDQEPDHSNCIENLPITSASSSDSQAAFPASNAIDNNLATKWMSTLVVNPSITLQLGAQKLLCGVSISWADGNLHSYRYIISLSTDGNTFTNVLSGTSTGTTTSPEKYTFTPTSGGFVKITITESTPGSANSIAQIFEIDVFGKVGRSSTTPGGGPVMQRNGTVLG